MVSLEVIQTIKELIRLEEEICEIEQNIAVLEKLRDQDKKSRELIPESISFHKK
jgi:hypothetical protein